MSGLRVTIFLGIFFVFSTVSMLNAAAKFAVPTPPGSGKSATPTLTAPPPTEEQKYFCMRQDEVGGIADDLSRMLKFAFDAESVTADAIHPDQKVAQKMAKDPLREISDRFNRDFDLKAENLGDDWIVADYVVTEHKVSVNTGTASTTRVEEARFTDLPNWKNSTAAQLLHAKLKEFLVATQQRFLAENLHDPHDQSSLDRELADGVPMDGWVDARVYLERQLEIERYTRGRLQEALRALLNDKSCHESVALRLTIDEAIAQAMKPSPFSVRISALASSAGKVVSDYADPVYRVGALAWACAGNTTAIGACVAAGPYVLPILLTNIVHYTLGEKIGNPKLLAALVGGLRGLIFG